MTYASVTSTEKSSHGMGDPCTLHSADERLPRVFKTASEDCTTPGTLVDVELVVMAKEAEVSVNSAESGSRDEIGSMETVEAQVTPAIPRDRVDYKSMHWLQAGFVMIAETISLGILSLPAAIAVIGFVPGVLLIAGLGLLVSYTGYVLAQFKAEYHVHNYADAAEVICGRTGRWLMEVIQLLVLVFIMAAHILTFSVLANVLSGHGTCTVTFSMAGTLLSFFCTIPRTLKIQSYLSVISCISICAAIVIAMIGVALVKPGLGDNYAVTPSNLTSFHMGTLAVSNMIIAFSGHIAFFQIIDEMKKPEDFPKALALLQTCAITFYIVIAVVIYYYAGQQVASPALGSASPLVRKIAYGIAIPTIIIAGVINAHIAAKNVYFRIWAKNMHVTREKNFKAIASWLSIVAGVWILAWFIASVIPVFNQMLGLIGSLFGTWFSLGFPVVFWFFMTWARNFKNSYCVNWKKVSLATLNASILIIGALICILGLYGSIVTMQGNDSSRLPFSCADNSV